MVSAGGRDRLQGALSTIGERGGTHALVSFRSNRSSGVWIENRPLARFLLRGAISGEMTHKRRGATLTIQAIDIG